MALNHSVIFSKIQSLAASYKPVREGMSEIIALCARDVPHDDWVRLAALDYDKDVVSLSGWIGGVFREQPAPFPIQGLWFGICNPAEGDNVWADLYVGSLAEYSANDEELEWLLYGERYYPEDAYAQSRSLRAIYEVAYGREGGLGNDAEWPLCLAFGALAVRSLLRGQTPDLVGSSVSRIGVVVGFDGGDMLKVGELTESGLVTAVK